MRSTPQLGGVHPGCRPTSDMGCSRCQMYGQQRRTVPHPTSTSFTTSCCGKSSPVIGMPASDTGPLVGCVVFSRRNSRWAQHGIGQWRVSTCRSTSWNLTDGLSIRRACGLQASGQSVPARHGARARMSSSDTCSTVLEPPIALAGNGRAA